MPWNNVAVDNSVNLAIALREMGVEKVVFSPGSRNAALTLGFKRTGLFDLISIPDERVAGFIALGIRDESRKPVAVLTTSGSAAANLLPAVTEAYFREKELFLITADRPKGAAGNWVGQTIFQEGLFKNHVVMENSYDFSEAQYKKDRFISDLSPFKNGKGPVHLNIHFSEPFYPEPGYPSSINLEKQIKIESELSKASFLEDLPTTGLPILILGQQENNDLSQEAISLFIDNKLGVVFNDITSNVKYENGMVYSIDFWDDLKSLPSPSYIVSFGRQILSKKLIHFLRERKLPEYHIGQERLVGNPFNSTQRIVELPAETEMIDYFRKLKPCESEVKSWHDRELNCQSSIARLEDERLFSESKAYHYLVNQIPAGSNLHVANSLAVRYAHLFQNRLSDVQVFSNRGTSGIDGCLSTAVGASIANKEKENILLIGDQAFFYDSNGLWLKDLPQNLKIFLFNNGGGGIFELIDGPAAQPEFDEVFYNPSQREAENICLDFGVDYHKIEGLADLELAAQLFNNRTKGIHIFEVFTDRKSNLEAYSRLKRNDNGK